MSSPDLVINEVDYDTVFSDRDEFVELYNPTAGAIVLTGLSVVLVDGYSESAYLTIPLAGVGSLAAGQYLVIGSPSLIRSMPAAVKTLVFPGGYTSGNLENGAAAVALVRGTTVLDSLAYEGTSYWDSPVSRVSLKEGAASTGALADSNWTEGTLSRLPNGQDTNVNATDFRFTTAKTPGGANRP